MHVLQATSWRCLWVGVRLGCENCSNKLLRMVSVNCVISTNVAYCVICMRVYLFNRCVVCIHLHAVTINNCILIPSFPSSAFLSLLLSFIQSFIHSHPSFFIFLLSLLPFLTLYSFISFILKKTFFLPPAPCIVFIDEIDSIGR